MSILIILKLHFVSFHDTKPHCVSVVIVQSSSIKLEYNIIIVRSNNETKAVVHSF